MAKKQNIGFEHVKKLGIKACGSIDEFVMVIKKHYGKKYFFVK